MDYKDYNLLKKQSDLHFWYKARMDLIAFLLSDNLDRQDLHILDIGCGTGTELELLSKYGQVSVVDINKDALQQVDDSYEKILGDLEKIDLGEKKYDLVCAFDILEHLEKDKLVMEKIKKSLKDEALFIFTVPAFPSLFSSHDIALEHKRRYAKNDLEKIFISLGMSIKYIAFWNSVLFPLQYIFRVVKRSAQKIKKPKIHKTEAASVNPFLNFILFKLMSIDLFLIKKKIHIAFGLSLFGVVQKTKNSK